MQPPLLYLAKFSEDCVCHLTAQYLNMHEAATVHLTFKQASSASITRAGIGANSYLASLCSQF